MHVICSSGRSVGSLGLVVLTTGAGGYGSCFRADDMKLQLSASFNGRTSNASAARTATTPTFSLDLARLLRQHDGDAVSDRIGKFCGARDQLLPRCIEFERPLRQRTNQNLQQFGID